MLTTCRGIQIRCKPSAGSIWIREGACPGPDVTNPKGSWFLKTGVTVGAEVVWLV